MLWPWMIACAALDRDPPEIAVLGPDAPVRTAATFQISAHDAVPGLAQLLITVDGQRSELLPLGHAVGAAVQGLSWVFGVEGLDDGDHRITFTAVDGSWLRNRHQQMLSVRVDRAPPVLELAPGSREAGQGRTLPVWIRADEPLGGATITLFERTLPMFPVDGAWRALVGVEIRQEPGPVPLRVIAQDRAGNEAVLDAEVEIRETAFDNGGRIRMTRREIASSRDERGLEAMRTERDARFAHDGPEQQWTRPLGLPVAYGRPGAPFGRYMTYRDGERTYHTGMDFEKREGARISAAAAGVVTLASEQTIFGNAVIVDHGQGVMTSYNHLATVDVREGDRVTRGQIIGTMGATGQAYGPHLHWVVVAGRSAVDPAQWVDDAFSTSPFDVSAPTGR